MSRHQWKNLMASASLIMSTMRMLCLQSATILLHPDLSVLANDRVELFFLIADL